MFRIPLMRPSVGAAEHRAVHQVLESGMLTEGSWTRDLEAAVEEFLGVPHVIAVTSCTTGLEIALRAIGVGPGDDVIVPNFTYPATASAVAVVGARPVLADIDPDTMLIDLNRAHELVGPRTRALIPVSLFGNPLDASAISRFCEEHGVEWIEDAACALGAEYAGERVGGQAKVSVFSLHPRKMITTGEGGLIATEDAELAAWMRSYKHFGVSSPSATRAGSSSNSLPSFGMIGTNAKLSNLAAAIGATQMGRLDKILARRRALACHYQSLLAGIPDLRFPTTTPKGLHSYQSFCVFVPFRDRLLEDLRAQGVEVQIGTFALNREPAFRGDAVGRGHEDYPGSDYAFESCLCLPLFENMRPTEQREVVEALKLSLEKARSNSPEHGRNPSVSGPAMGRGGGRPCAAS